jgi:hypothetical protein
VEIVDARVEVRRARHVDAGALWARPPAGESEGGPDERECPLFGATVPALARSGLEGSVAGPCLVDEGNTVTVVPPGATARVEGGHLVVTL